MGHVKDIVLGILVTYLVLTLLVGTVGGASCFEALARGDVMVLIVLGVSFLIGWIVFYGFRHWTRLEREWRSESYKAPMTVRGNHIPEPVSSYRRYRIDPARAGSTSASLEDPEQISLNFHKKGEQYQAPRHMRELRISESYAAVPAVVIKPPATALFQGSETVDPYLPYGTEAVDPCATACGGQCSNRGDCEQCYLKCTYSEAANQSVTYLSDAKVKHKNLYTIRTGNE